MPTSPSINTSILTKNFVFANSSINSISPAIGSLVLSTRLGQHNNIAYLIIALISIGLLSYPHLFDFLQKHSQLQWIIDFLPLMKTSSGLEEPDDAEESSSLQFSKNSSNSSQHHHQKPSSDDNNLFAFVDQDHDDQNYQSLDFYSSELRRFYYAKSSLEELTEENLILEYQNRLTVLYIKFYILIFAIDEFTMNLSQKEDLAQYTLFNKKTNELSNLFQSFSSFFDSSSKALSEHRLNQKIVSKIDFYETSINGIILYLRPSLLRTTFFINQDIRNNLLKQLQTIDRTSILNKCKTSSDLNDSSLLNDLQDQDLVHLIKNTDAIAKFFESFQSSYYQLLYNRKCAEFTLKKNHVQLRIYQSKTILHMINSYIDDHLELPESPSRNHTIDQLQRTKIQIGFILTPIQDSFDDFNLQLSKDPTFFDNLTMILPRLNDIGVRAENAQKEIQKIFKKFI